MSLECLGRNSLNEILHSEDTVASAVLLFSLFWITLISRSAIFFLFPDITLGAAVISGAPYSDALEWFNQAIGIYNGNGMSGDWSARRPFYPILLATVFAWTGPSYRAAVMTNILMGAVSVCLVYLICERVFNRLVAVTTALTVTFNPWMVFFSLVTLTETSGMLFSLVSIWFLTSAIQTGRTGESLVAGVAFGLENLSRTLSLCAFPGFSLLSGCLYYRRKRELWRSIAIGLMFILGMLLVLAPWIARQKITHGILAISDNAASGLYAASSPVWKSWTNKLNLEAEERGVSSSLRDTYEYYTQGFINNLRHNPRYYFSNVVESFQNYLIRICPVPFGRSSILPFIAIIITLMMASYNVKSVKCVTALLMPFLLWTIIMVLLPENCRAIVVCVVMVSCLFFWPDRGQIILFSGCLFVGLGVSFFALGEVTRIFATWIWIPTAFLYATLVKLSEQSVGWFGVVSPPGRINTGVYQNDIFAKIGLNYRTSFARVLKTAGIILTIAIFVGWAKLIWSNFIVSPTADYKCLVMTNDQKRQILKFMNERLGSVVSSNENLSQLLTPGDKAKLQKGDLALVAGKIKAGAIYRLVTDSNPVPEDRILSKRGYKRSSFYLGSIGIILPFDIPDSFLHIDLIVVGRMNVDVGAVYDKAILEGLTLIPLNAENGEIDFDHGFLASDTGHLDLIESIRNQVH